MAHAIPGTRYLFSILQHLLVDQPNYDHLRLGALVKQSLQDWAYLVADLAKVPTLIQSLVPNPPSFIGAIDASGTGLGGFWIPTPYYSDECQPIIFRLPFPPEIQSRLVTQTNPTRDIMNSDLELVALVYVAAILQTTSGSTLSTATWAYVLRWMANLTRSLNFNLLPVFAAVNTNTLADFCSRSFDLLDQAFYDALISQFPITGGWRVVPPPKGLVSNLISVLSGTMLPWESLDQDQMLPATPGACGKISAAPLPLTPPLPTCQTPYQFFKYLLTATNKAKYLPASLRFIPCSVSCFVTEHCSRSAERNLWTMF
jgi:hypothetical protein